MAENICWYEERMARTGIDFISIKRNGQDTLVFNPLLLDDALGNSGNHRVTKDVLNQICMRCNLCIPEIKSEGWDNGYRIERRNYQIFKEAVPLFSSTTYLPVGEKRDIRVAFVDDDHYMNIRAESLSMDGFHTMFVHVDSNVRPGELGIRELKRTIIEWKPDWVVSDKGLGFVDGIDLILACKEAGISTAMLTGEHQTAETRKVAHVFITKPTTTDKLIKVLESPPY